MESSRTKPSSHGRKPLVLLLVLGAMVVIWRASSNEGLSAQGMERTSFFGEGNVDKDAFEEKDGLDDVSVASDGNCAAGYYYDSVRSLSCALCPKNYYCPGGTLMLPCPAGTIQPRMGQATCVQGAEVCVLGQNYNFEGNPCAASGDPHQTSLFSGGAMNFMGSRPETNQYYYVTACFGKSQNEIPFNIIGTHWFANTGSASGFDYMTLELFEPTGARHLVFLNPMQLGYIANAGSAVSTRIPSQNQMTSFTSGAVVDFGGGRFRVEYTGTKTSLTAILMVDGTAITTITLRSRTAPRNGRPRMLAMVMTPIKVFQCHACGVCGNFVEQKKIPKCTGGYMPIPGGVVSGGLTWKVGDCQQRPITAQPIPCKAGSTQEAAAKTACEAEKALYAATCGGDLVTICDRLATSCVEDVCLLGGDPSVIAHGIYGQALGEIAANRGTMVTDFAPGRTQNAASEVSLVCGSEDFVPYSANGIGSEMVARSRLRLRQVNTSYEYGRAVKCGSNAVVLGVLSGMDMSGTLNYVRVTGKGLSKMQGELTVSVTSVQTILNGISTGYVATCFSPDVVAAMDVQASVAEARLLLGGKAATATKTFTMACASAIRTFSVLNSIQVRKVGVQALQVSVRSGVTQSGTSATASVRFSTCSRSQIYGIGASVVAYCPSAVQGGSQLSTKYVQSGMVILDTIFPPPNNGERVVTLRASLVPGMACDNPHVTVGFADVDVSGGIEVSVNVVHASVCATGLNIQVKAWGTTTVNGVTAAYLAVCPN